MALPIIDLTSATVRPVDISTDSNRYGWMGKGDFSIKSVSPTIYQTQNKRLFLFLCMEESERLILPRSNAFALLCHSLDCSRIEGFA
jgi:hypothetical protein